MLASSHGFFHVMYILRDHLALRVPLKSQYGHNWKLLTGQRTAQSRQIFWKKWILQNVYKIRANNLFSIRLSSCVYLSCCCLVTAMSDSFATPWTVIRNTPLSMGFPRQEHQSGLPFPSPGDLPVQTPVSCTAGRVFITDHQVVLIGFKKAEILISLVSGGKYDSAPQSPQGPRHLAFIPGVTILLTFQDGRCSSIHTLSVCGQWEKWPRL